MTAGITSTDIVISNRSTEWHGLAKMVNTPRSAAEACEQARIFTVREESLVANCNPRIVIPGMKAIVRNDTNEVLGTHSDRYSTFQYFLVAEFGDAIIGLENEIFWHTMGTLFGGKKFFGSLELPPFFLAGDEYKPMLNIASSHDGTLPTQAFASTVRMVCWNTVRASISGAKNRFVFKHMGNQDPSSRAAEARQVLGFAKGYHQALERRAQEMLATPISTSEWESLVATLFPMPSDASKRQEANVMSQRQDLNMRLSVADLANIKDTAWGSLQAVADFADHSKPLRDSGENWKQVQTMDTLLGSDLVEKAMSFLGELVGNGR